ncbi:O-antigen ligase family protein [Sphaerospermopsis torques-reginae]|uniref:O-antigen ligase family protein n=1 Tax=Sphaerospermopsis torques-reginae ITEP-024 TaxID=984208 RepID=A0ABX8WU33_9CYAN|nr:O-antigen ligase family protein [Sphaerospermopsis torques-reginae]QYX29903.1 O-antigen ligase family protein [Sphaerospermopsis torques-reginae ITEP-024]
MKLGFQYQYHSKTRAIFSLNTLLSGLFCLYILLGLIAYIQTANGAENFSRFPIIIGLSVLIIETLYLSRRYQFVYQLTGVLLLGFLLNVLVNDRESFLGSANILSNIGIVLFLLRRPLAGFVLPFTYLLFGFVVAYFTYYFYNGIDPNEIFLNSSRNTVSWLLMVYSVIIYIVSDKARLKTQVLPAVMTVIFSVMSYGRSGIICSFILLIGILLLTFYENRKNTKFYIFMTFLGILFMFFLSNGGDIGNTIYDISHYFYRLETKGLSDSDGREYIWNTYISQMNMTRFLFGTNPEYDSSVISFNSNYHNSFIAFHASFGIASIIFMFLMLGAMVKLLNRNKLLLLILITFTFRAFTDSILFLGTYDFLVYYVTAFTFIRTRQEANFT